VRCQQLAAGSWLLLAACCLPLPPAAAQFAAACPLGAGGFHLAHAAAAARAATRNKKGPSLFAHRLPRSSTQQHRCAGVPPALNVARPTGQGPHQPRATPAKGQPQPQPQPERAVCSVQCAAVRRSAEECGGVGVCVRGSGSLLEYRASHYGVAVQQSAMNAHNNGRTTVGPRPVQQYERRQQPVPV
jgi:hypothetical protein